MKPLLALVIGALTLIRAQAAPIELTASTEGTGSVEIGGSGDRIGKANLVLRRDGNFTLGLVGDEDTRFSGTWRPSERDNVSLRISEADNRDARGNGHIDLRLRGAGRFELDRISLWGENDRGRSINARFTATRVVTIPVPPLRPRLIVDSERSGIGRLEITGRNNYRITRVHVQLFGDGRAHVHTEGSVALRYEGTWTRSGDSTATLNMRGGLDNERMQGFVQHRSGRFWRIELSGTHGRRYHSLEFVPGR